MPVFHKRLALAASATVENALSGWPYEYAGRPSVVTIALARDATLAGLVEADITFGGRVMMQAGGVSKEQGQDQGVKRPDNVILREVAAGGDRLQVKLQETGGAAGSAVDVLVDVEPI